MRRDCCCRHHGSPSVAQPSPPPAADDEPDQGHICQGPAPAARATLGWRHKDQEAGRGCGGSCRAERIQELRKGGTETDLRPAPALLRSDFATVDPVPKDIGRMRIANLVARRLSRAPPPA